MNRTSAYVACATFLRPSGRAPSALVNTSSFRARGVKRLYQAVLNPSITPCRLASATRILLTNSRAAEKSSVIYNGVDSANFEPVVCSKPPSACESLA